MEIEFGLFAAPLTEQLKGYLPKETAQGYDIIANFVISARIDGKLTDREEHKLFDYLCKEIEIDIKKNKGNKNE